MAKKSNDVQIFTFVMIPKATCTEALYGLSWDALRERAERGECGMSVQQWSWCFRGRERVQYQIYDKPTDTFKYFEVPEDVALFRECTDYGCLKGRPILHAQTW